MVNWFNSNWQQRIKITLDNVGRGALTGFPVMVKLGASDVPFSAFNNDGSDIRMVDPDNVTELNFEIGHFDKTGQTATIWVKVDVDAGTTTQFFYMYFDNASATAKSAAFQEATWDANYKGVWHFTETSGPYLDSTGNSNDSTAVNAVSRGDPGLTGLAFQPSGAGVVLGNPADLQINPPFTLEAILKRTTDGTTDVFMSHGTFGWGFFITSGGLLSITHHNVNFASSNLSVTSDGSFHYLGLGYTVGTANFHKDGSSDAVGYSDTFSFTDTVAIGAGGGGVPNDTTDGLISEARISNIERSPDYFAAQNSNVQGSMTTFGAPEMMPPICWNYTAKYRGSRKVFKVSGVGPFPKRLQVPSNVDIGSGILIDNGKIVNLEDYSVEIV